MLTNIRRQCFLSCRGSGQVSPQPAIHARLCSSADSPHPRLEIIPLKANFIPPSSSNLAHICSKDRRVTQQTWAFDEAQNASASLAVQLRNERLQSTLSRTRHPAAIVATPLGQRTDALQREKCKIWHDTEIILKLNIIIQKFADTWLYFSVTIHFTYYSLLLLALDSYKRSLICILLIRT